MAAGRIKENWEMYSDWHRPSPAGSDSTQHLKSITAEEPDGGRPLKVLQQIPLVPSCHSYGYMILSHWPKKMQSCCTGASSHQAIGHSQLHSIATFIQCVVGSKFTPPVVWQWISYQILNPARACWTTQTFLSSICTIYLNENTFFFLITGHH